MNQYTIDVKIQKPFANLYRNRHVMVAVLDGNNCLVLGTKKNYPKGISRLLGGGVDRDEDYLEAGKRELEEESGLKNIDLQPLTLIHIHAYTNDNSYDLDTMVYVTKINSKELIAGDDTDKFITINPDDVPSLVEKYNNLDGIFTAGDYSHNWSDYGKVYGELHKIVLEELKKQNYL